MIDLHYYINTFLLRKSRKDTGIMTKWSLNCKIWPCGHLPLLGSAQIHKSCYLCHLRTQPYSKYYGNKLLDKFLCRIHFWGGIYKHICIFICVCMWNGGRCIRWRYSLEGNARDCSRRGSGSDDLQDLLQRRQAAAHLESHLVCVALSRKRQWEKDTQWRRGGKVRLVWFTGWTGDLREGEPLFLQQEQRIELWNKVIPGVSLFNLKSAHADSEQSSFNGGQMLPRL